MNILKKIPIVISRVLIKHLVRIYMSKLFLNIAISSIHYFFKCLKKQKNSWNNISTSLLLSVLSWLSETKSSSKKSESK
jgi:hypothetical protein